jgi:hypothetical protein
VKGRPDDGEIEETTANLLREYLNIESRSDLLENENARENFRELIQEYRDETREGSFTRSN